MNDRKYIAISIKHSDGCRFTLWGWERTKNEQKRCFSGYVGMLDYDKCEIYSLEDFREEYGHGVIKCDEAVSMTKKLISLWEEFDTVLVEYSDYMRFLQQSGCRIKGQMINW